MLKELKLTTKIDPNLPRPPLTDEVKLIGLETVESEYHGMITVQSSLVSVVAEASSETKCKCPKFQEEGPNFVKAGFGDNPRIIHHATVGRFIQISLMKMQLWKCLHCGKKCTHVYKLMGWKKKHTHECEDNFNQIAEISTAEEASERLCVPKDSSLTKNFFCKHIKEEKKN